MCYAPFEPLKFTDSKEFEEMLAYVKALSCEEGNLVKKSASVYLPRAEGRSWCGRKCQLMMLNLHLYSISYFAKTSFRCVVFETLRKEFPI